MDKNLMVPVVIGLIFTAWSIVGKFFKVDPAWLVTCSGLKPETAPSRFVVAILSVLGMLNGLAMIIYGTKTADHSTNTSFIVVGVAVMMLVWAPVLDWGVNSAIFNSRHLTAFFLALLIVFLMSG